MKEKEPTPIPLRAHRKKSPEPIVFPTPPPGINLMTPDDEPIVFPTPPPGINLMTPDEFLHSSPARVADLTLADIRNLVAKWVAQALYKTAMRMSEYEIVEMGESQFEAFIRSILEDEE